MLKNHLDQSASLYLKQHAHHPVFWQLWDKNIWAQAEKMNRPVLLSIGYSSCHWCHVMAHETFENQEIANFLNENFICVKIDREEYPAIDMIYQRAISLMGVPGGWPLTVFVTPLGKPFWGGTYFPPFDHYGRPGFFRIIQTLHQAWQNQSDDILQSAETLTQAIQKMDILPHDNDLPTPLDSVLFASHLLNYCDFDNGGIGDAPKFPQTAQFEFLWRHAKSLPDDTAEKNKILQWLDKTLDNICLGGLFDHLGGGFARYATDKIWLVPHFEKMLYDNALLLNLLCHYRPDKPLYAHCIHETVCWIKREMLDRQGGFYASMDADSDGREGMFYLWDETEIQQNLGGNCERFLHFYHVTKDGHLDGKNILNRLGETISPDAEYDASKDFSDICGILFALREKRPRPGRDEKILADWNGLMITALAQCYAIYHNEEWLQIAKQAFDFVSTAMQKNPESLYHCYAAGIAYIDAGLDDYCHMIMAALTLYNISGDDDFIKKSLQWVGYVQENFSDKSGAYRLQHEPATAIFFSPITAADSPIPSGNAIFAKILFRLALITGNQRYEDDAHHIIGAFAHQLPREFPAMCGLLNAAMSHQTLYCFALRGKSHEQTEMRRLICANPVLDFVIIPHEKFLEKSQFYGYEAELSDKNTLSDDLQIIICHNQRCFAPMTDMAALAEFLETLKKL